MANDAVLEFERGVGAVVGGAFVGLAFLVDALGNVRGREARDALHVAEEVVDDVAPVAEHIDDHAAAVFLAVVPARALGGNRVALEDPVAELTAHAEDVAEEAVFLEAHELHEAGQPELVLHHAILHAGVAADLVELVGVLGLDGRGLFAIDVLACGGGLLDGVEAAQRALRVEINLVVGAVHHAREVGRVFLHRRAGAEFLELGLVTADEDRVGHDDLGGAYLDAALLDDRVDGAQQVLVRAHASRDAVHDDADLMCGHFYKSLGS